MREACGYRRVTPLLHAEGWHVNHKRVERIWRREGLKVPSKQAKKGRLWLADGSCIRLRPQRRDHVWSYDLIQDRTHEGRIISPAQRHPRVHLSAVRQEGNWRQRHHQDEDDKRRQHELH
jgi:transposase InsO family protein